MHPDRYIFDVLYGIFRLPEYAWKIALTPELQRLREVRLCNINSLCLTGGANINRYEHVVGTTALAMACLDSWPEPPHPFIRKRIVLAALMHDIGSAAFGHSVQYVLDPHGYKHDSIYDMVVGSRSGEYQYQDTEVEQIFYGMARRLTDELSKDELAGITEIVRGGGPYGALISGSVDLDNIDNVFRLAFHIGLTRDTGTPLALGKSLRVHEGSLLVEDQAVPLLEEWHGVRKRLYKFLLLNPDEFAAKCMLQEAVELAQDRSTFRWYNIDSQLIEALFRSSADAALIVSRLMAGDLYGCGGIFSTSIIGVYEILTDPAKRRLLESELRKRLRAIPLGLLKSAMVSLHAIKDVNKTDRKVEVTTTAGRRVSIGEKSGRVLIGAFYRNKNLSMRAMDERIIERSGARAAILAALRELVDPMMQELEPYAEASRG